MLLVGLPEKSRVVEARPQHTFMPVANDPLRISIGIQHRQEVRLQFVISIFNRKIFLVIAHHCDQNFLRKAKEIRIEATEYSERKFRKIDHRIKQILVFPPARARDRAGGGIESFANLLLAGAAAQHLRVAQCTNIRLASTGYRDITIRQDPVTP